jgi:hypothetical protein
MIATDAAKKDVDVHWAMDIHVRGRLIVRSDRQRVCPSKRTTGSRLSHD